MAHKRKLIREEIVAALKNGLTLVASGSIYESRVEPIFDHSTLPAIAVYTREETAQSLNDHHKLYSRQLSLAVEILVRANENTDDDIDAISEEIEAVLNSVQYERSNNYQAIEYTGTDVAFIAEGRVPKAAARLTYQIEYETQET